MGCFEIISHKNGHSKMTQKIGHSVQPIKNTFFFTEFKNTSDRKDLNLFFYMKKVTVRQLLMEIEQLENFGCFCPFFGYTESDSHKSAQKGPKSDPIVFKICMSPFYSQMRLSRHYSLTIMSLMPCSIIIISFDTYSHVIHAMFSTNYYFL